MIKCNGSSEKLDRMTELLTNLQKESCCIIYGNKKFKDSKKNRQCPRNFPGARKIGL